MQGEPSERQHLRDSFTIPDLITDSRVIARLYIIGAARL